MRQIELAGSYAELGRAYGQIIVDQKLNRWWQKPGAKTLAFAEACEQEIRRHAPGFLEELRGIAEVCQTNYGTVLSNMTVGDSVTMACNVVAVAGPLCANGRTLMARNHDWFDEDLEWVTCFRTAPKDGLRSLGFGFTDPGRYDGINEAGLAIAGSAIPFYTGKLHPGLRMNVVQRWVLDTCEDVPSAVKYLKKIPHQEGIAYLLADKSGRIARVEAAPEDIDVEITDDGMLATINTFQSTAMTQYDQVPANNIVFSYQRRIQDWHEANKGQIDLPAIKALCSGHENGLCDHGQPSGTIYSWLAELGTDEAHVAHGRPCENEYQKVTLLASN
jgi:predicted choloylglycine hydrolase